MSNFLFPKHNAVQIHIPKTGGTSIRKGVFKNEYEGPVFGEMPEKWVNCYCFTFVRNPYDRLISGWKMFVEGTSEAIRSSPPLSLNKFLDIVTNESIIYDEKRRTYLERIRHHMIPQTHPFNCLRYANFIGRFESFQQDFEIVCDNLSIPKIILPKMHFTKRGPYEEYLDDQSRTLAKEYYRQDFEQLKYKY
jgi:hypothetical protein